MQNALTKLSWSFVSLLLVALLTSAPFDNVEGAIPKIRSKAKRQGNIIQVQPRIETPIGAKTSLADFNTAPFPYDGSNGRFWTCVVGEAKGHRAGSGRVYWEDQTYRERRVLLHIPKESTLPAPAPSLFSSTGN